MWYVILILFVLSLLYKLSKDLRFIDCMFRVF
jgi:hypothetical protein